jgi:hypothetical protein
MRKYSVLKIEKIIIVCSFCILSIFPVKAQEGRHVLKQGFTVDFFKQQIQENKEMKYSRRLFGMNLKIKLKPKVKQNMKNM